jgi:hypothetical protein
VIFNGGTVRDVLSWLHSNVGSPVSELTTLTGIEADDAYGSAWFYERGNMPLQPTNGTDASS